ncbi:5338_t:CDS:1, partial [Cetraspora pellucida]
SDLDSETTSAQSSNSIELQESTLLIKDIFAIYLQLSICW